MDNDTKCCLCNGPLYTQWEAELPPYWKGGHNAEPLADGRCCTKCNNTKVIPERIALYFKSRKEDAGS